MSGERLGRYRLEEVIGVGSFATVHRAQDELLQDTVVIKVLAENHSLNPEIRERFITEGRSLRRVDSPQVVTVHDIGESPRQQPFLVLDHADRGSLADRVRVLRARRWQASVEDLLAVAQPLAEALEAVHRAHLVHRDLSPGNMLLATDSGAPAASGAASVAALGAAPGVASGSFPASGSPAPPQLVRADERLLLADLGMCKDLAMNSGLTVSGGTAGFRPPEQSGPGVVDTRADIWAASAVMRWLAEGAELPAEFHQVLARGMRTEPADRQSSIADWYEEIEESLRPAGAGEPSASEESSERRWPSGAADAARDPVSSDSQLTSGAGGGVLVKAVIGAVLVAVALLVGLLAGLALGSPDQETASEVEGASLVVQGPSEVRVGEPATFIAEVEGVESWVWVLPTGTHVANTDQAVITPTSAGSAEIILRSQVPGGPELEARHSLRVTE